MFGTIDELDDLLESLVRCHFEKDETRKVRNIIPILLVSIATAKSCMRVICAIAMGQVLVENYIERIKRIQSKFHDFMFCRVTSVNVPSSYAITSWIEDSTVWSCIACITAIAQQLCFELTAGIYASNLVMLTRYTSSLEVDSILQLLCSYR